MVYKLKLSNYFFTEGNNMDKIQLIDNAISINSLLLYSYNIKHKKDLVNRYKVIDFDSFDFSKVKQKSLTLHDLSKFKDIDSFERFITKCNENNKDLILPSTIIPYSSKRNYNSILRDIYLNINKENLPDILDKSVLRDFKIKRLLS